MAGRTALKILLGITGVAVSVALISTAFFHVRLIGGLQLVPRFDFSKFLRQIPAHAHWLLPFLVLSASMVPLRAAQWQTTLPRPVPYRERYHLVAIGAFVHNAVPGKLGDVFRSFLMARTQRLPFVQSLGSVAVCKLLEFGALMLLVSASFLGPFAREVGRFEAPLRLAVAACIALVLLVVALARLAGPIARRLDRVARLPKLVGFLHNVEVGLGAARSLPGLGRALLLSVPPVLAPAFAYGIALHQLGIEGGLFAGAVVLGAIAIGQATPGIPAGMGIYYFVTSWTARNLGASAEDAAAFAALTHLGTVASQVAVGAVSLLVRRVRLTELRRSADEAAEAMKHVSEEPASA